MHVLSSRRSALRRVALGFGLSAGALATGALASGALAQAAPRAVFFMTNDTDSNVITAFDRSSDGTLSNPRDFPTGARGTGTPEDSANGLILANVSGESSPTSFRGTAKFLSPPTAAATRSPCSATSRAGWSWST